MQTVLFECFKDLKLERLIIISKIITERLSMPKLLNLLGKLCLVANLFLQAAHRPGYSNQRKSHGSFEIGTSNWLVMRRFNYTISPAEAHTSANPLPNSTAERRSAPHLRLQQIDKLHSLRFLESSVAISGRMVLDHLGTVHGYEGVLAFCAIEPHLRKCRIRASQDIPPKEVLPVGVTNKRYNSN
jgi:hypothetical protein